MINTTQQPEALRLANVCSNPTRYSMDAHLIAAELRRQHAELETLRAKLKTYEDLGDAAYAALSDVDSLAQEIRRVDGAHRLGAGALAEALMPFLRASHGQAPAPVLHLVNDAFAEVAMAYPKAFALHKVGLADTAVRKALATTTAQATPAAVEGPKKWAPEEVEDGERGIRWVTNEGIHGRPTDHDVREYLKRTPTANGCLCDECKVFYAAAPTTQPAPQPSPAAQVGESVQEDAARLDWLEADESNRVFHLGKSWYTRAGYGSPHLKRASLREAIDAAIAAQGGSK